MATARMKCDKIIYRPWVLLKTTELCAYVFVKDSDMKKHIRFIPYNNVHVKKPVTCHTLWFCLPTRKQTFDDTASHNSEANIASVRCCRSQQCIGVHSSGRVYNNWQRTAVCNKGNMIHDLQFECY